MQRIFLLLVLLVLQKNIFSQSDTSSKKWVTLKDNFVLDGYIQTQWAYSTKPDSVWYNSVSAGFFDRFVSNRFSIRRGRLNFTFEKDFVKAKLGMDLTERSFGITDMYVQLTEPWMDAVSLKVGNMEIPFGAELDYSSSKRTSMERSNTIQHLFPSNRDLGVQLALNFPENNKAHGLQFNVGVFNGSSGAVDINKYKDFVLRARFDKVIKNENWEFGAGVSSYFGGHNHISDYSGSGFNEFGVFKVGKNDSLKTAFVLDSTLTATAGSNGLKIDRNYFAVDAHVGAKWAAGKSSIGTEIIFGQQPGRIDRTFFPNNFYSATSYSLTGPQMGVSWPFFAPPIPANPTTVKPVSVPYNTMIRNFFGGHVTFSQSILETGLEVYFRYDWYDPNTEVEGKEISIIQDLSTPALGLSVADIKYQCFSPGIAYNYKDMLRISAQYDIVRNEETNIEGRPIKALTDDDVIPSTGFKTDMKDDVFVLRFQYKFSTKN